jgi:hypothetical protein
VVTRWEQRKWNLAFWWKGEGGRGQEQTGYRLSVERGNKHGLGTFANFHQPSLLRFTISPQGTIALLRASVRDFVVNKK